jgi:hypothetical protein
MVLAAQGKVVLRTLKYMLGEFQRRLMTSQQGRSEGGRFCCRDEWWKMARIELDVREKMVGIKRRYYDGASRFVFSARMHLVWLDRSTMASCTSLSEDI